VAVRWEQRDVLAGDVVTGVMLVACDETCEDTRQPEEKKRWGGRTKMHVRGVGDMRLELGIVTIAL
jgi:hypothetical protein